jgi:hypothetical protein
MTRYEWTPASEPPSDCCPQCNDGDGFCAFPHYGVAPHICFYKLDAMNGALVFGASQELPEDQWPANFVIDETAGPPTGYPRPGTYTHCLACGRGERQTPPDVPEIGFGNMAGGD